MRCDEYFVPSPSAAPSPRQLHVEPLGEHFQRCVHALLRRYSPPKFLPSSRNAAPNWRSGSTGAFPCPNLNIQRLPESQGLNDCVPVLYEDVELRKINWRFLENATVLVVVCLVCLLNF